MKYLSSYLNVYNTALVLIQRSGFHCEHNKHDDTWVAVRKECRLQADNPVELLGLVSVYEKRAGTDDGEYWWRIDSPDLLKLLDP